MLDFFWGNEVINVGFHHENGGYLWFFVDGMVGEWVEFSPQVLAISRMLLGKVKMNQ